MTHTAHPKGQRLGIIKTWSSTWFTRKNEDRNKNIKEDFIIREYLEKKLRGMFVAEIEIDRNDKSTSITLFTSRPGIIIGRNGEGIESLTSEFKKYLNKKGVDTSKLQIRIEEVKFIETNASLVAQTIVEGLEKRMAFRRVMKQTAEKVFANREVQGVRFLLSGRLGGSEIARSEQIKKGRIPLQTLRADIDYAETPARLAYGAIGVKVWLYKGDKFENEK